MYLLSRYPGVGTKVLVLGNPSIYSSRYLSRLQGDPGCPEAIFRICIVYIVSIENVAFTSTNQTTYPHVHLIP